MDKSIEYQCGKLWSSLNEDFFEFGIYVDKTACELYSKGGEPVVVVRCGGFVIASEVWGESEES